MLDVLIKGATVIDGTGAPRLRQDVGIEGDRITRLGQLGAVETRATIDAAELVVAPGFIDVHNHSDGWLLKHPNFVPKTSQGFTTEILMSDGISYAPVSPENYRDWFLYLRGINGLELRDYRGWRTIAQYLALLDRKTAQNVASQVPYANVRVLAAGWGRQRLDDTQTKIMRRHVQQAMDEGAVGVSTGLDYPSQCFAKTDEIAEVCEVMAPFGGIYATHVRYKKTTLKGIQEAVEIGRRAGVPVHISHMKGFNLEEADKILSYIDQVASQEVDFSFDVYPYLPGSTMVNFILPHEVWEDGPLSVCEKLRDPVVRDRFQVLLDTFGTPLDLLKIGWVATKWNARYQGLTLAEFVAQTGRRAADAICDLLIEENLSALAVLFRGNDEWIEPMLKHPKYMMGSDGIWFPDGVLHPRMYGSAAKLLGPMVRDRRLFSLEEAVRKISGYPATRFGLKDRGVIREGAFADLVVFNPETIADRATYEDSHQLSVGVEHVLVNGTPIWRDGKPVENLGPELPGRVLQFNR